MAATASSRLTASITFVLVATAGIATAQSFMILSDFNADAPGLPPATGGPNQPTAIINVGVTVETSANGIATQPLVVDDGSCDQAYFGGVYYDLPVQVTEGTLRVEATIAANQLTDGVIFDTGVSYLNAAVARLSVTHGGLLVDHFFTPVASYAPNTPFRLRADLDMSTFRWACTIDDELNGFGDDPVVYGLPFVNSPSLIPHIGTVYLSLFGSFSVCTGSRVVAYDDVLITDIPPIFTDDFETGHTGAWSATVP